MNLSIIVPVYNEQENIARCLSALMRVLDGIGLSYEVVCVDDGSRDDSLAILVAERERMQTLKIIRLSRNFGKDIALSAGIAHARGQAVIPFDCDLQHPPELIPKLVEKWREGYDMVIPVRANRPGESFLRRKLTAAFYRMLGAMAHVQIPTNAGDFRLMDRKVVKVLLDMPERCRFMKGLYAWPGFRTVAIPFEALPRPSGNSRWNFWRLWNFGLDGLFSFSTFPLRIWTYLGIFLAAASFLYIAQVFFEKIVYGIEAPGYASLISLVLFFNAMLLISNGIQGEYLARIFEEVKGRPLYTIERTWGLDEMADSKQVRND